tara:strand:+ start:333 stop:554 length:222 start_codon:yes stop_codon:yes gene_type:complete
MSYTWYLVILVIAAFALLYPKDAEMTTVYLELQLRKLWLFLRLYPQFQLIRFRMMFMLLRVRYNRNNHLSKTK